MKHVSEKLYIESGDKAFLKTWSEKLKVSEEKLEKFLDTTMEGLTTALPDEDVQRLRMRGVRLLLTEFKSTGYSKASNFEGVVVSVTEARDMWSYRRYEVIEKATEYIKMGEPEKVIKAGLCKINLGKDATGADINIDEALDMMLWNEIVAEYNETDLEGNKLENPVPHAEKRLQIIHNPEKQDGSASANAGKVVQGPTESMVQTIYGFAVEEGKDEPPKGFILTVFGASASDEHAEMIGKPVKFSAVSKPNDGDLKILTSSRLEFIEAPEAEVGKVLEEQDYAELIERFFGNQCIEQQELIQWAEDQKVPGEFRDLVIIKQAIMSNMDPVPNANGNCKIWIEQDIRINDDSSDELSLIDQQSSMVVVEEAILEKLEASVGSKVMVIGRAFVSKPQEGYEDYGWSTMTIASSIIPYKDGLVAKQETPTLGASEVDSKKTAKAGEGQAGMYD